MVPLRATPEVVRRVKLVAPVAAILVTRVVPVVLRFPLTSEIEALSSCPVAYMAFKLVVMRPLSNPDPPIKSPETLLIAVCRVKPVDIKFPATVCPVARRFPLRVDTSATA